MIAHWLRLEPEPKGEERVVVVVSYVHRELIDPLEPRPSKLASEAVVTEQDICHSLAFASRKPCSHEGVHLGDVLLDHQRASRDHHHDTLDGSADFLDHCRPGLGQGQVIVVAHGLSIGRLAHDHDGIGEVMGLKIVDTRILLEDNLCGAVNGFLDRLEDRCACSNQFIAMLKRGRISLSFFLRNKYQIVQV